MGQSLCEDSHFPADQLHAGMLPKVNSNKSSDKLHPGLFTSIKLVSFKDLFIEYIT